MSIREQSPNLTKLTDEISEQNLDIDARFILKITLINLNNYSIIHTECCLSLRSSVYEKSILYTQLNALTHRYTPTPGINILCTCYPLYAYFTVHTGDRRSGIIKTAFGTDLQHRKEPNIIE